MPAVRNSLLRTRPVVALRGKSATTVHVARQHELRQPAGEERQQVAGIEAGIVDDDDRHHLIVTELGAHPDRGALAYRRMLRDGRLDLEGGDVLAAAADRVVHPVDEVEVAVLVFAERVAGVKPAAAPGFGGAVGHPVVAEVQRTWLVAAHDHLADLTGWERLVVLVDDADLVVRPGQPPPAAGLPRPVVPAGGDGCADLGLAVADGDLHAEAPLEVGDLRDHRAEDDAAYGVVGIVVARRCGVEQRGERADESERDAPEAAHLVPHARRAELVARHEAGAAREHVVEARAARVVEQRHRRVERLAGGEHVVRHPRPHLVREPPRGDDRLGRPGGARGEHQASRRR